MSENTEFDKPIEDNTSEGYIALKYAHEKGLEIDKYLGKGHFGEAYLTKDSKVIKVTKDAREAYTGLLLMDNGHDNIVDIFNVEKLSEKWFVIEQEYTNHNYDADELYWGLTNIIDEHGYESISELLEESKFHKFTPDEELISALTQLKEAKEHMESLGIGSGGVDMQADNYSYIDGKIKTFDNMDSTLRQDEARELINKILNPTLKNDAKNKRKSLKNN